MKILRFFFKFQVVDRKIFKAKIKTFFNNIWNNNLTAAILLYFLSMILRFIPNDQCFLAARLALINVIFLNYFLLKIIYKNFNRIFLSIDVILWYFKILTAYIILESLGPILLIIKNMVIIYLNN